MREERTTFNVQEEKEEVVYCDLCKEERENIVSLLSVEDKKEGSNTIANPFNHREKLPTYKFDICHQCCKETLGVEAPEDYYDVVLDGGLHIQDNRTAWLNVEDRIGWKQTEGVVVFMGLLGWCLSFISSTITVETGLHTVLGAFLVSFCCLLVGTALSIAFVASYVEQY